MNQWVSIREARRAEILPGESEQAIPEKQVPYFKNFLNWRNISDYMLFITALGAVIGVSTCLFKDYPMYQNFLGLTSSAVEAVLGVPQFLLNYRRQNTEGLT